MHDDDLTVRISKAPLDVREIQVLRSLGVRTVSDLAEADLDGLLPQYLPQVRHRSGAEERLRLTARRAKLVRLGVPLERITTGPLKLPSADVEIDFDLETAANERVYLWGFLVDDRRKSELTPVFQPHVSWTDLDDDTELALARQAMAWLQQISTTPGVGPVKVYHYSEYELVRMRQILARTDDPLLAWGVEFAADHFVDLFTTIRDNWFGLDGLGLKAVASHGAGFSWRDPDPGGLNSQRWFDQAVHASTEVERQAARQRVLEYNEDDVLATHQVRRWIRSVAAS